jgi:anionic cell wall polymer biosynthesis LytR-Cps2A-Psr (LCP) family protein
MTLKTGTAQLAYEQFLLTGGDAEFIQQQYAVAAGVSDQEISLGPLDSAKLLLLESDQSVSVKINNSLIAVTLKTLLLMDAAVTSLTITNAGSNPANIKMFAVGA